MTPLGGGGQGRLHDRRPRRDHPPLPRVRARDRKRLLRAVRRGPAPRRRADRQGHRLAPRALAGRVPPDSVQRWPAFKETNPQLKKFGDKFQTGLISNIDDKLLGLTRRHIPHDFDLVVTAQQVRSYKPDPAHFTECARRIGTKKGWVHIAASYYHDVEPCLKAKIPVIWVNRNKEELDSGPEEAHGRGQVAPRGGQAARRRVAGHAGRQPPR